MNPRLIALAALLGLSSLAQSQVPNFPLPDLAGGLKATPGCLGVEQARTTGGKLVVFAWFEDKKAVLRWYNSEMHQQLIKLAGSPPDQNHTPLADIADDSGPILAIASLTPSSRDAANPLPLPVSQISIELYQPLPGGVFVGGRFAPDSLKVPGMRDYTPVHAK
jgi:hypothetical protein